MVPTGRVKDELARVKVVKPCCRKAQVAAVLRLAGSLHVAGRQVLLEVGLGTAPVADWLCGQITGLYGHQCQLLVTDTSNPGPKEYAVRVAGQPAAVLARQAGLVDERGRPIRGMPPRVVHGWACDAQAVWRGAFLARGSLTGPGRPSALEVVCPTPQAAVALVGAARRAGVRAEARQVRFVDRVAIRDEQEIGMMLSRLGAGQASQAWREALAARRATTPTLEAPHVDRTNQVRSAHAARVTSTRVARALALLGDDAPPHLADAGRLRLQHPQVSLQELAQAADPPISKNAIASRIYRLLALADRHTAPPREHPEPNPPRAGVSG